jgi:glutamate racemase
MVAGVFDSGAGGLTVVKSLLESHLFEQIIYFGDTARVPYGNKDKQTVVRYSLETLEFFNNFDIDMLIAACNTVSSLAIEELRAHADFQILGVIEPGVLALEKCITNKHDPILILGTQATITSGCYVDLLRQHGYTNITQKATGLFVPIVEEGISSESVLQETMKYYFHAIENPCAVILGCTHFPLLARSIGNYFGGIPLIHSGESIVAYLHTQQEFTQRYPHTHIQYFASENPHNLQAIAKRWLFPLG